MASDCAYILTFTFSPVIDTTFHPQTGERIFAPFRFSAFVPVNLPIVAGMLGSGSSMVAVAFWQWMNQTYNVCVNHANRNASNELSMKELGTAYFVACGSSVGLALGLGQVVKKAVNLPSFARTLIQSGVPFLAVAGAGVLNVGLMRGNEMTEGIMVQDKYGADVAKSTKAGTNAVQEVAISRVVTSGAVLAAPPILLAGINRMSWYMKRPSLKTPVNLAVIGVCLWGALPLAIGVFPQNSCLPVAAVEPSFTGRLDSKGDPLTHVYFNKGL
jgi:sideroflexin-5